jgi:serine/threonine protein kinase
MIIRNEVKVMLFRLSAPRIFDQDCRKIQRETRKYKVVTKKNNVESIDSKFRFVKKTALLNSTKGHRNIIRFLEFCKEPLNNDGVFLLRFSPVWSYKSLCSLEDFVQFVDDEFDFASFADLLLICAKDVVKGLKYWHSKNIAHRDLNPGNILVSNQHYSSTSL